MSSTDQKNSPAIRATIPPSSEDWRGYVCVWRRLRDHPRYKDSEFVHVWLHLLLNATHKVIEGLFCGKQIRLQPGQLITGRHAIARDTGVHESKVKRILEQLKSDRQIDQQSGNLNSLITVINWRAYQFSEHQIDQQMTSQRPANDQQLTTNNTVENEIIENDNTQSGVAVAPVRARQSKFVVPSLEEVKLEAEKIALPALEAENFFNYYESNGWKVGRNPMRRWTAALRNWHSKWDSNGQSSNRRGVDRSKGTANEGKWRDYANLDLNDGTYNQGK
ncbi:MAG TPA: hypothetical protein VHC44_17155 [Verrucomicrobiae bacterium]|nr:hypothetical protein [Verrucomicrobiae bacterium]